MHPILLHVGRFTLPTFGVLAALGLMAALSLALRCAPFASLQPDTLWNASLFVAVAAFVLSRLLLVLTNLHTFLASPVLILSLPSLTGTGLFLTGMATLVYLRLHRLSVLQVLDAWAAPATLLWAFLSLGHLAEGSDPGLPSRASWAIRVVPDPDLQQPVGLFAAVAALAVTAILYRRLQRPHTPGHTAALALLLSGVAQFVLTFLRQPYPYAPDSPSFPLDPIQFLALVMVLTAGFLHLTPFARAPRSRHRIAQVSPREVD